MVGQPTDHNIAICGDAIMNRTALQMKNLANVSRNEPRLAVDLDHADGVGEVVGATS